MVKKVLKKIYNEEKSTNVHDVRGNGLRALFSIPS